MLRLLLWILLFTFSSITRAGNLWGITQSTFMVQPTDPFRFTNGLLEKINSMQGLQYGGTYNLPITRYSNLVFGIGLTKITSYKETQGVFPENGSYGFISAKSESRYWSFPVCFSYVRGISRNNRSRSTFWTGFRFTYVPYFLNKTETSVAAFGGAVQSEYYSNYKNAEEKNIHSVLIAITEQVFLGRRAIFGIDPFIGFSSAYFENEKKGISDISYGLHFSLQFKLPHISLELEHYSDPKDKEQQQKLKEKQKEIEEQLHKQPK